SLDGLQEATCIGAVNQTVIVGQAQVHHVADGNRIVALCVGNDHWTLHDRTGAQDCDLWLVDDRGVEQCTNRTDVGDREGTTGQLVWTNVVGTGAVCQVGNARSHTSQVQIASVRYNRNQQALVGIDCKCQVLGIVVGDLLGLFVVLSVQL